MLKKSQAEAAMKIYSLPIDVKSKLDILVDKIFEKTAQEKHDTLKEILLVRIEKMEAGYSTDYKKLKLLEYIEEAVEYNY